MVYKYCHDVIECWIKKSVIRVTIGHHVAILVTSMVTLRGGFFCPHLTPMIDTFFAYLLFYNV